MTEYPISSGDKVEKYHVAILFDKSTTDTPDYIQLCKSTENTITMNAETEDLDFIVDKNPTTIIKRYKPSFSNPLTMYKGSEDYEYFFPKVYDLPTGADANGKMLIVFMNAKNEQGKYKAWNCDVTFVIDNIDPANSQLTMTVQINGTIKRGLVTVTSGTPSFTEDSDGE